MPKKGKRGRRVLTYRTEREREEAQTGHGVTVTVRSDKIPDRPKTLKQTAVHYFVKWGEMLLQSLVHY